MINIPYDQYQNYVNFLINEGIYLPYTDFNGETSYENPNNITAEYQSDGTFNIENLSEQQEADLINYLSTEPPYIEPEPYVNNHKASHELGGEDQINGDNIASNTDHTPFVIGSSLNDKFSSVASGFQGILDDIVSLGSSVTSLFTTTDSLQNQIDNISGGSGGSDYQFWSYSFEQNKELTPSIQQLKAVSPKYFLSTVGSLVPNAWHTPSSMSFINNGRFVCPSDGYYQVELQLKISEIENRNYERGVYGYFEIDGYNFPVVTNLWIKKENGHLHINVTGTIPLIAGQELGVSLNCVRTDDPNNLTNDVKIEATEGWTTIIKTGSP